MNRRLADDASAQRMPLRAWLCSEPDPLLSEVAQRYGGCSGDWRRQFARYDPDAEGGCRLHYRHRHQPDRVVGVSFRSSPATAADWTAAAAEWVAFPDDPALPTLASLWRDLPGARVARYRPGHRCTLEVTTPAGRYFVKVFADDIGAPVHEASLRLWRVAATGQLGFRVPEPGGWDARMHALWQHALPGEPLAAPLLGGQGAPLAALLGSAAASLPRAALAFPAVFTPADQMLRTRRYVAELLRRLPALGPAMSALLDTLQAATLDFLPRAALPIHGALHLQQWLVTDDALGLVDFDRLCMGDPELDVATFVTEMEYEDPDELPVADVNAAFVEAYVAGAGALDAKRMAFYTAHKHLAKALKCVRGLRPDAERRAERALCRAFASAEVLA